MQLNEDFLRGISVAICGPAGQEVSNSGTTVGTQPLSGNGSAVSALRLSLSWTRLQAHGQGQLNRSALDCYDRLTDELLAAGIEPWMSLSDGELPIQLQDSGGWMNRQTAFRFAEYSQLVGEHFGDRIAAFVTLDRPFVLMHLGYAAGTRAPGKTYGMTALAAGHHQLLGHGLAVQALRSTQARLGLINSYAPAWPGSDEPRDRLANLAVDATRNQFFTKPLFGGGYPVLLPDLLRRICPEALAAIKSDDLSVIAQPLDFLGVSYCRPDWVNADDSAPLRVRMSAPPGYSATDSGCVNAPEGLAEVLRELHQHYVNLPPLYLDQRCCVPVADPESAERLDCVRTQRAMLGQAVEQGIDIRGHFIPVAPEWLRTLLSARLAVGA